VTGLSVAPIPRKRRISPAWLVGDSIPLNQIPIWRTVIQTTCGIVIRIVTFSMAMMGCDELTAATVMLRQLTSFPAIINMMY
jgi:hypothetical protein